MQTLEQIVEQADKMNASDVHIVVGLPIKIRVDGQIRSMGEEPITEAQAEGFARILAGGEFIKIERVGEIDLAVSFECGVRGRVNIFRQRGYCSIAIRILKSIIPLIDSLGLPPVVSTLPDINSGIVLVTGEAGSGKSTTLAAVIDRINHTKSAHIITLEDPIEYIYRPDRCIINQRQIGSDTMSYSDGLRSILREDPDVILIGEMRDYATMEAALTAAETGQLVFATLHTNSAAESVDRIVNSFPEGKQRQVRMQLSTTLRVVLTQQLLPMKSGGRCAACEVMVVSNAIKNLIREGKTPQIDSFIAMNVQEGSITMDSSVTKLVKEGKITREVGSAAMRDPEKAKKI